MIFTRRMAGALIALALALTQAAGGAARADDAAALGRALDAADAGRIGEADAAAAALRDPLARDLWRWRALTKGEADWSEAVAFLAAHPDWPRAGDIRAAVEPAIPPSARPAEILAFFGGDPPRTAAGALALARARGPGPQTDTMLAHAWTTLEMTPSEEEAFRAAHPQLTRALAVARLDEMLWRGETEQARRMIGRVDPGWQALAEARIALRRSEKGVVDSLIARVPAQLASHPGLAFERFQWRARADRDRDAEQILMAHSSSAQGLGRPESWAKRRASLARAAFREGRARDAYALASRHFLRSGPDFADLEWLSGWIALRGLNDPDRAARHFDAHRQATSTPISLGRAGYWLGRAYEAKGDKAKAREWYAFGAEHATSFYGQLAAEKIGRDLGPVLAADERLPDPDALLKRSDLARAALLLERAGQPQRARLFLLHAAERARERETLAGLGALAQRMGRPDLAVRIGKTAAAAGHVIMPIYYPRHDGLSRVDRVEPALAKAIARQESEMNPEAVSPAGALGLMQLMPATAQATARTLGVPYSRDRLTSDPAYNARLGSAYLADMLDRFDGARILAAAAYNAGPQRVSQWIDEQGDPRSGRVDPIDWIESIPFTETRNYVQRVMEGLHVYRARLGGPGASARDRSFAASLTARAG